MLGENPNTNELFFNKILCALIVKETKKNQAGFKKEATEGEECLTYQLLMKFRCSLCALWFNVWQY